MNINTLINKNTIWFIPGIAVALGIFILSTFLALPTKMEGVSHLDKWEHTFAYLVLSFSFLFAFKKYEILDIKAAILIFLGSIGYGLLLEFIQYQFFQYRRFEWLDALANTFGVVLAFYIYFATNKKFFYTKKLSG